MCGIAGILDPRGVPADAVRCMAGCLQHRGPDDATVHLEPGIGLGFRRLSIIDLESGAQPIANEDRSIRVICNGEIYNYRELRRELVDRGHRFSTRSDAEVLVHLYEESGRDFVQRLRGMFALALWDSRQRKLTLARDHLGQKPLFWAHDGTRLWFASEIKAITAVAPQYRRVSPTALDEYLTLRVISEPRTMFEGIRKLPAAHVLEADGSAVTENRYWSLRFEPKSALSQDDALDLTEQHLREAVDFHLVSDVPVGAFLSGGIDSGLVTAMMAQTSDEPFDTFSVGVPYGRFDEAPAARQVAQEYSTRHHESRVDGDVVRLLPRVIYHLDEPSDPLSVCMFFLAGIASDHVKVALGGDGGDEMFGGYDRYYGVPYVKYYEALPGPLRRRVLGKLLEFAPDGIWYKSLSHRLRWMHELAEERGGRRYARSLSYFYFTPRRREELYTDHFKQLTSEFDPEGSLIAWHDDGHLKEALDRMLLADSMVRLPNHSVMILDRTTMAHGLEARSPFLDHSLAEFAATLPARLKVKGRERRILEMRLARKYLPAQVVARPKQGFSSALPYMLRDQYAALFRHFLPDSHLIEHGWLRGESIATLLGSHLEGRSDHGNRLWLLLNAELWHRIHIENTPLEDLEAEVNDVLDAALGQCSTPARQMT